VIQIEMILDPYFISTIQWHAIKVTGMCLIFVTNTSCGDLHKYSFTPPIQNALLKIYKLANDLDSNLN
jgi:hypothetical protein